VNGVEPATQRRRVRVWFGEHMIADYRAEPALAARYAAAMSRRFAGLRVTNDPIAPPSATLEPALVAAARVCRSRQQHPDPRSQPAPLSGAAAAAAGGDQGVSTVSSAIVR
jgi:hypothetical protein